MLLGLREGAVGDCQEVEVAEVLMPAAHGGGAVQVYADEAIRQGATEAEGYGFAGGGDLGRNVHSRAGRWPMVQQRQWTVTLFSAAKCGLNRANGMRRSIGRTGSDPRW